MEETKKKKSNSLLALIIIIIIVAVLAIISTLNKNKNVEKQDQADVAANTEVTSAYGTYTDGTTTVVATYNNSPTGSSTVTFTFDGKNYNLPIAMSGSGARFSESFTDVDKGMQLWEHQGEITISNDGKVFFVGKLANLEQAN